MPRSWCSRWPVVVLTLVGLTATAGPSPFVLSCVEGSLSKDERWCALRTQAGLESSETERALTATLAGMEEDRRPYEAGDRLEQTDLTRLTAGDRIGIQVADGQAVASYKVVAPPTMSEVRLVRVNAPGYKRSSAAEARRSFDALMPRNPRRVNLSAAGLEETPALQRVPARELRIAIVDDSESEREATVQAVRDILEPQIADGEFDPDTQVTTFDSVKTATAGLQRMAQDGALPHLLIVDGNLRDGEGFAIVDAARQTQPPMRIIMCSAGLNTVQRARLEAYLGNQRLQGFVAKASLRYYTARLRQHLEPLLAATGLEEPPAVDTSGWSVVPRLGDTVQTLVGPGGRLAVRLPDGGLVLTEQQAAAHDHALTALEAFRAARPTREISAEAVFVKKLTAAAACHQVEGLSVTVYAETLLRARAFLALGIPAERIIGIVDDKNPESAYLALGITRTMTRQAWSEHLPELQTLDDRPITYLGPAYNAASPETGLFSAAEQATSKFLAAIGV